MRHDKSTFGRIDWTLVLLFLLLVLMGWLNIYAAVYNEEHSNILDVSQKYGKQLIWILTSLGIAGSILLIDGRFFEKLAYPIFITTCALLVLVLLFGKEVNGARSWFAIGSFSLQPSEFAKFATCLALAKYLGSSDISLSKFKPRLISLFIIFLPAVLIAPQPDMGSALVYTSLILVLYREGLSGTYIFLGIGLAVLFILSLLIDQIFLWIFTAILTAFVAFLTRRRRSTMWAIIGIGVLAIGYIGMVDYAFNNFLEDRHRNRINILLGKAHDPTGIGYNTNQSMIAIGSGGFSGKGYLQGTQTKFDFVPEQSTDFIFCTVGEEWGFVGTTVVTILFLLLLFRIIIIAERQKSNFSRIYGYGVASILFIHVTINIAMTIGLAPVIGIPLPFFSYGGSSLWGFTLLLFIFIKLDAYRWEIL